MTYSHPKPSTNTELAGNTNQLGVIPNIKTQSQPHRPGTISHGPGKNKPRIHLVSSKGKLPAGVLAAAIAQRNKAKEELAKTLNKTRLPSNNLMQDGAHAPNGPSNTGPKIDGMQGSKIGGPPNVYKDQLTNPPGVAKRPAPSHQVVDKRSVPQKLKDATYRNPNGIA
jgi:hypothetical protein